MIKHNTADVLNIDILLDWARHKAVINQAALERMAFALFDEDDAALGEFDRSLMGNSLRVLVHDIETRILSEIAHRRKAPLDLATLFGQDGAASRDHGYAYPILVKAGLLRDAGLIEVIKHRMQTHRLTLSLLSLRRESDGTSPKEEPQRGIIQSLLVAPEPESVDLLKGFIDAENDRLDSFQYPLTRPADLPHALVKQLCWSIAAALRSQVIAHSRTLPGTVDEWFESAAMAVLDRLNGDSSLREDADGVIDILIANGRFSPKLLMQLLSQGEVSLFEAGFARITGLRKTLISRLLYETGGEGLAVACKAAGFDSATFETIYGYMRRGRPAGDAAPSGNSDIIDTDNGDDVEIYHGIEQNAAEAVLERWRRDGDFLYAIKLLEQG